MELARSFFQLSYILASLLSCNGASSDSQQRGRSRQVSSPSSETSPSLVEGQALEEGAGDEKTQASPAAATVAGGKGALDPSQAAAKLLNVESSLQVKGGVVSYLAKTVAYGEGPSGPLKGYYVQPKELTALKAGLVAIPGQMGLSESFQKNLQRFVANGYTVLAVDFYQGKLPQDVASARSLQEQLKKRGKADTLVALTQAADYLLNVAGVHALGVIGWDEGGYWAIATALAFPASFAALINFYGSPFEISGQEANLSTPMFHVFVQEDPSIDIKEVIALDENIKAKSKVSVEIKKFANLEPQFLEPSIPNNQQDQENIAIAYQMTFSFLEKFLLANNQAQ